LGRSETGVISPPPKRGKTPGLFRKKKGLVGKRREGGGGTGGGYERTFEEHSLGSSKFKNEGGMRGKPLSRKTKRVESWAPSSEEMAVGVGLGEGERCTRNQ